MCQQENNSVLNTALIQMVINFGEKKVKGKATAQN